MGFFDNIRSIFKRGTDDSTATQETANAFANIMGPVNNNLGYIQYAVLAIVGGMMVVRSDGQMLTLGSLMAFMILSRSFNMPISQISNQINSIVMALAGAERVFELMDQEPERAA